jgi:DNA polymerase III subunit delta
MASVTLVVGDEDLLVERAVAEAVRAMTAAAGPDLAPAVNDVVGSDLSVDTLQEMVSPSLFAETRILVVRSAQDIDKGVIAALVDAVQDAELDVRLVAAHAGGVKGKAVLEALKPLAADVVTVQKLKSGRDREQFVIDEAKRRGGRLDRDAASDLVAAIGTDVRELATSSAQLVADVGRDIGVTEVALYYRGRAESSGFTIADRAVEGDAAAAIETLRWAFATGLDPILVSSSLAANLRLIAQVAGAGGGSPDQVAARLGMPAWKVRRAQGWRRKWRPDALATAVQAVATADADLKGAGDDPAYAVERAVLAVAAAANAPA